MPDKMQQKFETTVKQRLCHTQVYHVFIRFRWSFDL